MFKMFLPIFTLIALLLTAPGMAQEVVATLESKQVESTDLQRYPSSPLIATQELDPERRSILNSFFLPQIPVSSFSAREKKLCLPSIIHLGPLVEATKRAVATNEAALGLELLFERQGPTDGLTLERFSLIVEFANSRVFLKHTDPRFPSDTGGFSVPMANGSTRAVRLEGRLGADIFALIPPLPECSVQAVAVCARSYTKNDELVEAPYIVTGVRPRIQARADGLFAPPAELNGKLVVSVQGSAGITLPTKWQLEATGVGSLAQEIKINSDKAGAPIQELRKLETLPLHFALESRVDFGEKDKSLRTSSKRVDTELSKIQLEALREAQVGTSLMNVQGGSCYFVVNWSGEGV